MNELRPCSIFFFEGLVLITTLHNISIQAMQKQIYFMKTIMYLYVPSEINWQKNNSSVFTVFSTEDPPQLLFILPFITQNPYTNAFLNNQTP